jgi:hypothetical protein
MAELAGAHRAHIVRHVHLVAADSGELSVPADVAELLGDDAELEVGPGQIVTLRPARLRASALAAVVEPLDDPARLRHATTPLTAAERDALGAFLAG